MPDTKQQLGIELSLSMEKGKFAELIKTIEGAFSKIDLKGFEAKLNNVDKKLEDTTTKVSKVVKALADIKGVDAPALQVKFDEATLNKKIIAAQDTIKRFAGELKKDGSGLTGTLEQNMSKYRDFLSGLSKQNLKYFNGDVVPKSYITNVSKAIDAAYAEQVASVRKGKAAVAAAQNEQSAPFREVLTGASKQGLKYFNGDFIPKTYLTNENKAWDAALKEREARYIKAGDAIVAAEKQINDRLKQERTNGLKQLAALKEDRAREVAKANEYVTSLRTQGYTPFNGGYARTSAVNYAQGKSTGDLIDEAKRYGDALKKNAAEMKLGDEIMASLAKRGQSIWNGNVVSMQQYNRELKNLNNEGNASKTIWDRLGISLQGMAKHLVQFYAIRGVIFAVRNQIESSISSIIEYKQTLSEIAAITTATDGETKQYEKTISLLARSSKFSAGQIAEAMKVVAQSGIQRTELIPVTRASELLAAATGGSTTSAANVLTTTMNVWGVAADKAMGITNTLSTAMKNSKMNVTDLATTFNYLATSAEQSNMSIEETTSAISVLRNKGIAASTVGTGLAQFLKVLEAPTAKVKALFKELELGPQQVDPKLRSLGDILNTISEAGIKKYGSELALSGKISEAFEMRTGKAAKALVNSGDAIKSMTLAMKNSAAGFIALERSMEGPQVKLNKIKHEFMLFVQLMGDDVMGAITSGTAGMLNFVKGLQDVEVRSNVLIAVIGALAVAIVTAITAISQSLKTFYMTNPWLAALTVGMTAYSAIILATAGNLEHAAKAHEAFFNKTKEELDVNQRQTNELNKFIGTLGKVNGHKQTLNDLTDEQKKYLDALKPSMKGMLDHLDKEKSLAEQLVVIMGQLAEARGKALLGSAKEYNALKTEITQRKDRASDLRDNAGNSYNPVVASLVKAEELKAIGRRNDDDYRYSRGYVDAYGVTNPADAKGLSSVDQSAWMRLLAKDLEAQAIKREEYLTKMEIIVGGLPKTTSGYVDTKKAEAEMSLTDEEAKKKRAKEQNYEGNSQFPPSKGDDAHEHKIEELNKKAKEGVSDIQKALADATVEGSKLELDQLKENLKTDKDLEDYKVKATKALEEETLKKVVDATFTANKMYADKIGGTPELDKEGYGTVTPPHGLDEETRKSAFAESQKYYAQLIRNINSQAAVDQAKIDNTKAPKETKSDSMYSSDKEEKAADKILAITTKRLSLEKDMAKTAEQVRQKDLEILDAQIRNADSKEEAYRIELKSIENATIAAADQEATKKRYDDIKEKLEEIKRLKGEIVAKRDDESNNEFGYNFGRGATTAMKGMGTFKSNTDKLGEEMTSTALNGMANVIDLTIGKLAQLKWSWKDFATSLGSIMKDIAAELQKYIAKLMVVWAMEKLVNMFNASGGPTGMNSPSGVSLPAFNDSSDMFSSGSFYADGGVVTGGIQGVDSVPIMAMPEEYVVKSSVVRSMGLDFMHALNSGKVRKFAEGGLVGGSVSASSTDPSANMATIQIVNVVDPESIPQPTSSQIVNVISFDIAKKGSTYKTIKMALS